MASQIEVRSKRHRGKGGFLSATIRKADGGGHIVEHREEGDDFGRPQVHIFGKHEGGNLLRHVAKIAGVSVEEPEDSEAEEGENEGEREEEE